MHFSVPCECGSTVRVSAGQAGSAVTCPCGRTVPVPTLGELRAAASNGPPIDRPEIDRSHLQIFGCVLVVVGQLLGALSLPVILSGSGTADDRLTTYVVFLWVAFFVHAAGVLMWARGKGLSLLSRFLLVPLGFIAIIILLMTPTQHAPSPGRDG